MVMCLSKILTAFITIFCIIRETFESSGRGACAVLGQTDGLCYSGCPLYTLCVACKLGDNVIYVLL